MTESAQFRDQFPVLAKLAYLNAGTEGPVPRRAAEAARARIERELESGRCGQDYMGSVMDLAASLRSGYARMLGCELDELALTGSTTDGVNTVLSGLQLQPGDEILTSDEEHPGLLAPLGRARRRDGVVVRVVPFAELAASVGSATRLIACSHVSWVSGRVVDVDGLEASGVPVLLAGAHGLGAAPT